MNKDIYTLRMSFDSCTAFFKSRDRLISGIACGYKNLRNLPLSLLSKSSQFSSHLKNKSQNSVMKWEPKTITTGTHVFSVVSLSRKSTTHSMMVACERRSEQA